MRVIRLFCTVLYCTVLYRNVLCFQLFKPLGKDEMIKVEEIEALSDKKRVMRAGLTWLMWN